MKPLTPEEFGRLFDTCASAFRLETLQAYDAPEEAEDLAAWREGRPLPPDPWAEFVAYRAADSSTWQRVHVVREPLSEYLRYEFERYRGSVAAGEDVRIVVAGAHPEIDQLDLDFWGFDLDSDQPVVAVMVYDEGGRWIGAVENPARIEPARRVRGLLLAHSVPLADYLAGVSAAR